MKKDTNAAMRSLFRYQQLKEMGAPEILLESEKDIISRRIGQLDHDEILFITQNFNNYCIEQKKISEIEDQRLALDITRFLHKFN